MSSPETLLEHASWLRRLAASLVGDRAQADDLVQDTWVAALRRPPDLDRPARPWLARVVRNAARFRWRGETNRALREQAVAAQGEHVAPSSDELLARHELQQQLARLVGELAEPFRAAILLRYAEGLGPSEIARQLGIPASTVRGRVKEGLERLRRGLDDSHGGDRKAWLLLLAPIALWPRASHAAGLGVAAVLAAAGVVAILVVASRSEAPSSVATSPPTPSTRRAIARVEQVVPAGWAAQEGAPERHVAGRVVRAGAPVANALVRLTVEASPARELRTDDAGRFDFGSEAAHPIALGAAIPETLAAIAHLDLRDPTLRSDALELELQPCVAGIAGKVTDAGGNPIAHAQLLREDAIGTETDASGAYALCTLPTAPLVAQLDVVVRADGYGAIAVGIAAAGRIHRDFTLVPEGTITGTAMPGAEIWFDPERADFGMTDIRPARLAVAADADGRFRITGASDGPYRVGGAARGMTAIGARISVVAGATTDVALQMSAAAVVHGVVTANGAPVAGARVAVVPAGKWGVVISHDDPRDEPIIAGDAVTQADGTFVLDGIPATTTTFSALPMHVVSQPIALVAGDNRVAIATQPLGRIRGVVRRHGEPVPYARLDCGGVSVGRGINADGAGRFELAGLEAGQYSFYADDARRGAVFAGEFPPLGDGETLDHDIELAWGCADQPASWSSGAGQPVAGLDVRFVRADDQQSRCTTDAAGAFACAALMAGTYAPSVYPGDDASRPFAFVGPAGSVELTEDGAISNVRLAIDPRTTAIAGTVVDETGAPVADARACVHGATGSPTIRGRRRSPR